MSPWQLYLVPGLAMLLVCLLSDRGDEELRGSLVGWGPDLGALVVMATILVGWPVILAMIFTDRR